MEVRLTSTRATMSRDDDLHKPIWLVMGRLKITAAAPCLHTLTKLCFHKDSIVTIATLDSKADNGDGC